MSATEDAAYQLSTLQRAADESYESFASRLFALQIEVYSASAGVDLSVGWPGEPGLRWETVDQATRDEWVTAAKRLGDKHAN